MRLTVDQVSSGHGGSNPSRRTLASGSGSTVARFSLVRAAACKTVRSGIRFPAASPVGRVARLVILTANRPTLRCESGRYFTCLLSRPLGRPAGDLDLGGQPGFHPGAQAASSSQVQILSAPRAGPFPRLARGARGRPDLGMNGRQLNTNAPPGALAAVTSPATRITHIPRPT